MVITTEILRKQTSEVENETTAFNRHQTDADGCGVSQFLPAYHDGGSAMNKKKYEVKPMMQFKRGMMVVTSVENQTAQFQQKRGFQQPVTTKNTSGTFNRFQETRRRYRRGMIVFTPIENE